MRLVLTAVLAFLFSAVLAAPSGAHQDLIKFVNSGKADIPSDIRLTPSMLTVSKNDMMCLAMNDYFEARGESLRGRVAVAQVVLNRLRDPRFPNTICEVVTQNNSNGKACQFSWYCDGKSDVPDDAKAWRSSVLLAMSILKRDNEVMDPTDGALWFHTTRVSPSWSKKMDKTVKIDSHVFYTDNRARNLPDVQVAAREAGLGVENPFAPDRVADAGQTFRPRNVSR